MGVLAAALVLAACWCTGLWWRRALLIPGIAAFGLGAATLSSVLFVMAVTHTVSRASLGVLAATAIVPALLAFRRTALWVRDLPPPKEGLDKITRAVALAIGAVYLVLYGVHAAAPEIQPDAMTYHLGLAAEYLRLGGFPDRVGFYEMLPQGLDLLFMWAFAFGEHTAAKFVHLGFLLATVPLLFAIVRQAGWPDRAAAGAAVLYACAPVTGVSATSAYTEAGMVFFSLLTLYLLLLWRPLGAGIAAGFCYAIKFSGLIAAAGALGWALAKRRGVLAVSLGAFLMISPWMARNTVVAQNPLAPLFNRWFPNSHFRVSLEKDLKSSWQTYGGFSWPRAPWDLAVRGNLQGILGPVFLLLPAGLLALRERRGRLVWGTAAVLALPWCFNVGARFILPAAAVASVALAATLPRGVLAAAMTAHAALSWPEAIPLYAPPAIWQLHGFPWRVDREAYLRPQDEYVLAQLVQGSTQPGEKVYSLASVARAYTDREVLEYWHSSTASAFVDSLIVAALYRETPFYAWGADFPAQTVNGIRFRLIRDHPGEWDAHTFRTYLGDDRLHVSPAWEASADANGGDARLVLDGNLATRWRTYEPMRAGMRFEVLFDRPQRVTRAELLSHSPLYEVPMEVWLRTPKGDWRKAADATATRVPPLDLRRDIMRAIRQAGYDCILVPVEHSPFWKVGQAIMKEPEAWGVEEVWHAGWARLLRIKASP